MGNASTSQPCIVGYGNPFRRDDGIGAFVAKRLQGTLGHAARVLTYRQLDPVVLEEIKDTGLVILVDATGERLAGGRQWQMVKSERAGFAHTTHHFSPSLLRSLLFSIYRKMPEMWLVSIQGHDFGHGEGLTQETRVSAVEACREIAEFVVAKTD